MMIGVDVSTLRGTVILPREIASVMSIAGQLRSESSDMPLPHVIALALMIASITKATRGACTFH